MVILGSDTQIKLCDNLEGWVGVGGRGGSRRRGYMQIKGLPRWHRRRQWHLTPALLPGKSHGWWRLQVEPAVHGVARSQTWLSDFTFTFHFHALEKEMATHSSVLAWRIPGTGEPGRLPSLGSHRAGHDWSDLAVGGTVVRNLQAIQET